LNATVTKKTLFRVVTEVSELRSLVRPSFTLLFIAAMVFFNLTQFGKKMSSIMMNLQVIRHLPYQEAISQALKSDQTELYALIFSSKETTNSEKNVTARKWRQQENGDSIRWRC
jgi:hypothetical protein